MARVVDRIAERTRHRVAALAFDIARRGFPAAEEYARGLFRAAGASEVDASKALAIWLIEHEPNNPAIKCFAADAFLRQHCADAIAAGERLSPALSEFASRAILRAPTKGGKGRPASASGWQRIVAFQVIRDLQDAGIPAYHGDGADCDALFYGTDVVHAAIGVKERTVRGWWKKRPANLKKLGDT